MCSMNTLVIKATEDVCSSNTLVERYVHVPAIVPGNVYKFVLQILAKTKKMCVSSSLTDPDFLPEQFSWPLKMGSWCHPTSMKLKKNTNLHHSTCTCCTCNSFQDATGNTHFFILAFFSTRGKVKVPVNISDRTLSFVVIFKHFFPLGNPSVDINGTWQEGQYICTFGPLQYCVFFILTGQQIWPLWSVNGWHFPNF